MKLLSSFPLTAEAAEGHLLGCWRNTRAESGSMKAIKISVISMQGF